MDDNLPDTQTPLTGDCLHPDEIQTAAAPWGRLISCVTFLDSVDLIRPSISFGRSDICDIVAEKNRFGQKRLILISKQHFVIEQEGPIIFIRDISKNGTFLNERVVGSGNRNVLQNNDEISVSSGKLKLYIFKSFLKDDNFLPPSLKAKYHTVRELGRGACGEVRLAIHKTTCEKVAIKRIILGKSATSQMNQLNHPSRIELEISILRSLSHPCIISMKEIESTDDQVFIVLEFMEGGELTNRIMSIDTLSESNTKFLFYQMVLAVQYLHSKGITHRDLKPDNVLLLSDEKETLIKITDFGLSKDRETMVTMCGTLLYVAPEVLSTHIREYGEYGKAVDVWSLGVMLFYMLSKKLPFHSKDQKALSRKIVQGTYTMEKSEWNGISVEAKDLVSKMLVVNPRRRITLPGVLKHPWISRDLPTQYRVHCLLSSCLGCDCTLEFLDAIGHPEKKFKFSHLGEAMMS